MPPKIVDERTLVPLRFIGEAFGCQVQWDPSTQAISISDDSSGTPPINEPVNSPPKPAPAVIGQWEKGAWGFTHSNIWNIPGEPRITLSGEKIVSIDESGNGQEEFIYGKPIKFTLSMTNTSRITGTPESITILDYTPSIEIDSFDSSGNKTVVWKQTMPTLSGTLAKPDDYYSLEVDWRQCDMAGNQVPPGNYGVILQPGVLRYKTPDGNEHTQTLDPALYLTGRAITIAQP